MEKQSIFAKLQKIGQGAYGAVYRAMNPQDKSIVALKISRFDDFDEGVPSTCMREVSILKQLDHPHLVKQFSFYIRLIDATLYSGTSPRLELAFQYIDFDLNKYIKSFSDNIQKGLSEREAKVILPFCQIIIKSILSGLHYLHKNGILHRDLKPHNILITKEQEVKIADFGLGRVCPHPLDTMSRQIQTLWYRAPQLLLGTKYYGEGVDSWSVGCIFYELVEGRPLFQSDSEIGQLFEIFKILGTPKKSDWPEIVDMQDYKPTFPKFAPNPPHFKKLSLQGQRWLFRLVKANPSKRFSITKALNDRYLQKS